MMVLTGLEAKVCWEGARRIRILERRHGASSSTEFWDAARGRFGLVVGGGGEVADCRPGSSGASTRISGKGSGEPGMIDEDDVEQR